MLLGFKRRFAPFVEDGSKTHTVRAKRKLRPKVGETCHCYVDARQKTMRLLRRAKCVRVDDILIAGDGTPEATALYINGVRLDDDERNAFAWRDGFRAEGTTPAQPGRAFETMLDYWRTLHKRRGQVFPFAGDVIHWDSNLTSAD